MGNWLKNQLRVTVTCKRRDILDIILKINMILYKNIGPECFSKTFLH